MKLGQNSLIAYFWDSSIFITRYLIARDWCIKNVTKNNIPFHYYLLGKIVLQYHLSWLFRKIIKSLYLLLQMHYIQSSYILSNHFVLLKFQNNIYTIIIIIQLGKKRYLRGKTILTAGSVGRPGVGPSPRKINTFFLRSLALSVPIYWHFQSNGANWRSSKHLTKKFIWCTIE